MVLAHLLLKSLVLVDSAGILSKEKPKTQKHGMVSVHSFQNNSDDYHTVGLRGHIIAMDFDKKLNNWSAVPPKSLIRSEPIKKVSERGIANVLGKLVSQADEIIIATDFDREGELIGVEALEISAPEEQKKKRLKIKRARFSSLTPMEINRAFENLEDVDYRLAKAAEARQVVDLTWGAVLTRLISLASGQKGKNFLSVGRVQSPTLSLVVDRDREIREFVPKTFWNIKAEMRQGEVFITTHTKQPFWKKEEAVE